MRKIEKILTITLILTMFFCHVSFAAKLGEKIAGGTVVAIFKNKEYVAGGVTGDILLDGEVLEWSKWTNEDLITIYNRCAHNSIQYRKWHQEVEGGYVENDWYTLFRIELNKRVERKEIIPIGANNSQQTGTIFDPDGNPIEDEINFKVAKDMNEEDKSNAEKYENEQKEQTEKYKNYTAEQMIDYLEQHYYACPSNCFDEWEIKLRDEINKMKKDPDNYSQETIKRYEEVFEKTFGSLETSGGSTAIYKTPTRDTSKTSASSLDDMISDADAFISQETQQQYDEEKLKNFSTVIYNSFLSVGVAIALVTGIIIGMKYMMGSIEEKANYKQMLLPYTIGCFVIFGAFIIWKIVVIILESI